MRVRDMEIGEVQERFANLVWDHEPIPSGQLVRLCEEEFGWKKSTTYTQVRRLADKGLLQNEQAVRAGAELEKAYHLYGAAEAVRKGAVPE